MTNINNINSGLLKLREIIRTDSPINRHLKTQFFKKINSADLKFAALARRLFSEFSRSAGRDTGAPHEERRFRRHALTARG